MLMCPQYGYDKYGKYDDKYGKYDDKYGKYDDKYGKYDDKVSPQIFSFTGSTGSMAPTLLMCVVTWQEAATPNPTCLAFSIHGFHK
jgi:hypothetical protein